MYRHEDLPLFDRAFAAFWRSGGVGSGVTVPDGPGEEAPSGDATLDGEGFSLSHADADEDAGPERPGVLRTWSDAGTLADKDFADFTPEEVVRAREALDRLIWEPGVRRTRRWVPGRGSRVDLRRALARSLRSGGDLVTLPRRRRRTRPRPVVLLCDVSGSMERYSRMLVHFAHALARRHRRVEAFLFSTELTRITLQLRARRPNEALTAVSTAVPDWSGGTRIGGALKEFHQKWSRRSLRGGVEGRPVTASG